MRKVRFLVYLCILLVGVGHNFYAETHPSTICFTFNSNITKNHPLKFTNKDQTNTIIEDVDMDLEEEHLGGEDAKFKGKSDFFTGKFNFHNNWHSSIASIHILNQYYKSFKNVPPFCVHSTPFYITQRVLRI